MSNRPTYEELEQRITELEHAESEHKHAEEALHETLKFRDKILSESPVGITIYNAVSGQCMAANKSMAEFVGASKEQLLAQIFYNIPTWKKSGLFETAKSALR